jgi:site-specific DNA recombinase
MARNESTTGTAWLYLRLSKDKAGSGDSLDSQRQKLEERAKVEGLVVAEVFNEGAGRSAYKTSVERPEWERLVASVEPGVVVLAVETSRFSRNAEDGLRQVRRIRQRGGHVVTTDDGNDTRSTASNLPITVRLAVAEEESRLKSERLKRARHRDRQLGKWGGRAPYGHRRRPDGKLELDPETAPIARRIVDMSLAGNGAAVIARTLNEEGVPNQSGHAAGDVVVTVDETTGEETKTISKGWRQVSVSAYLRNPILCGWMPRNRREVVLGPDGQEVVVVVGPTICSVAERGRLLGIIKSRTSFDTSGQRRGSGRPTDAVLRGVLRCGRCGGTMVPSGHSYLCDSRRSGGSCPGTAVTKALVDVEALRRVLLWLSHHDPEVPEEGDRLERIATAWVGSGDGGQSEARAVEAAGELAEARERLTALDEAHFLEGAFRDDEDRYRTLRKALTDRIGVLELESQAQPPKVDLGPLMDLIQVGEALEDAAPEVIRSLVAATLTSATVAPAPYPGARWDPSRLTLEFRD